MRSGATLYVAPFLTVALTKRHWVDGRERYSEKILKDITNCDCFTTVASCVLHLDKDCEVNESFARERKQALAWSPPQHAPLRRTLFSVLRVSLCRNASKKHICFKKKSWECNDVIITCVNTRRFRAVAIMLKWQTYECFVNIFRGGKFTNCLFQDIDLIVISNEYRRI